MKEVRIESKAVNKGHYVPGMISGDRLYVSGQLPMDHDTGIMCSGDIADQAVTALGNVEKVLNAAGTTRDKVIMCRVYIPDMDDWDTVNEVYSDFFGDHRPARVVVPTRELHHGVMIEIEAIAEI